MKSLLVALVLATALLGGGVAFAQSGNPAPATDNLTVRDGPNPGEIIIAWDHVPHATHYRIGYVNMQTDYPLAKSSVTGDWINAFIYVDENARNIQVSNRKAEYTVRRLEQDVRHAFTVLTSSNFVDTGAAGSVSSEFSWPSNPRWKFHTVADRGGACPMNCPGSQSPVTPDVGARISLSDVDNTRGYRLTVAGEGFGSGATATVYVLNRPPTYPEKVRNEGACQAVVAEGIAAGSARVGADGLVAITFEVTEPMFKPGRVNHICVADSTGRAAVWDVEVFQLEISLVSLYPNCDAVRAHYPGGATRGSPIYRANLDPDGDGIACELASTVPSGNFLPIQNIGTFSGTGDNTDNVIRLRAGIYRFTTSRQNTDKNVFLEIVELSSGSERSVGIYGRGDSGGSELETIYSDNSSFRLQAGDYILAVDASDSTQDWTVTIELIKAH